MSREFDFRNDGDMFLGCVCQHVTYIVFGIVTAISSFRSFFQILTVFTVIPPFTPVGLGTEGAFLCQFQIFIDLQTPATGIGQMKMQCV